MYRCRVMSRQFDHGLYVWQLHVVLLPLSSEGRYATSGSNQDRLQVISYQSAYDASCDTFIRKEEELRFVGDDLLPSRCSSLQGIVP